MSVVSVRELGKGRRGKSDMQGHGDSTRVWRVVTDDPLDDEVVVGSAPGIPIPFEPHRTRLNLWAKEAECINEEASSMLWLVIVQYTSELPDKETAKQDPLERAWKDAWKPSRYQKPAVKGFRIDDDGHEGTEAEATTNSAGEPFDPPPEMDASRCLISLRINLPVVPIWVLEFNDAINDSPVTIRGIEFPKHTLKSTVEISELSTDNGVTFRTVSVEVEYYHEGWNGEYPDRGYNWRDAGGKLRKITLNGTEATVPMLLNGNGKPLGLIYDGTGAASSSTLTSATGGFLTVDVGEAITIQRAGTDGADLTTTVSAIASDNSLTLATPIVTDVGTAGKPAAQVTWKPNKVFYRKYRHYRTADYSVLNLPP